ncbi:hypothetical protein, variant [Saprolegnia diclina VS20]|uniref:Uncharacterized protein n=1 Tax=Saprolegnia diclina (strain VS20) TaxID=1156394 RepID=T0Q4A9_SAPDV|nr:hypothetical protein, variant [Saprolegnia diclina VS20]EQC32669.1 hypothetical protein, variant [Saprolegnia diclina VS20]|eukprot:XP_008613812.1 hypothetical protein, variant [Saprolegnia diclina VS20]
MRLAYFRRDCDRADVFESSYLRCHHAQGLKVLRCFPHCRPACCPHSSYRNCGASVSVRVTGVDATSVVAYARFESVGAAHRPPTMLTALRSDVRSRTEPRGTWLLGVVVASTDGIVFEFNRKRSDGWHYDWHGSSSTRNRSQKHVLQTYLFQQSVDDHLTLVATLASSPFTIASYRRAKIVVANVPRPVPSLLSASSSSAIFASTHQLDVEYAELPRSSTQETAARLLQLFELCAQVPVTAVAPAIEARVWAEAARHVPGVRQPPALFLLRQLAPFDDAASRLETIALAVLCWFITLSSRIHDFCRRYDGSIYDNTELHEAYNRAVESLARSLDVVLATLGESTSSLSAQLPPPTVPQPSHAIGFAVFARILQTSHVARTQPLMRPDAVYGGVWAWRVATPIVRALQTPSFLDVLWSWLGACGLRLCLDGHVFSKHQVSRDDISMTRDRPVVVWPMNR